MERGLWFVLGAGLLACLIAMATWRTSSTTQVALPGLGPAGRPAKSPDATTPPPGRRRDPSLWDYGSGCFGLDVAASLALMGAGEGQSAMDEAKTAATCLLSRADGTLAARLELWDDRSLEKARKGSIEDFLNREAAAAAKLGPVRIVTLESEDPVQFIGWRKGGEDKGIALTGFGDRVLKITFENVPREKAEAFIRVEGVRVFEAPRR